MFNNITWVVLSITIDIDIKIVFEFIFKTLINVEFNGETLTFAYKLIDFYYC